VSRLVARDDQKVQPFLDEIESLVARKATRVNYTNFNTKLNVHRTFIWDSYCYMYIFISIEQKKDKQENQNIACHLQGHQNPFFPLFEKNLSQSFYAYKKWPSYVYLGKKCFIEVS